MVTHAWLAALWILVSPHSISPQPPPSAEPTFVAQGAFIALVVTNLDASLEWYKSNLDLHLIKRGKSPRVAAETAVLGGHNVFVELIHYTGRSLAKHIQSHGIEARSFEDKKMRCRTFIVRDGDGNLIQFFAKTD